MLQNIFGNWLLVPRMLHLTYPRYATESKTTSKLKIWKSMWRTSPEIKSWISKLQSILWGKSIAWGAERNDQLSQIMLVKWSGPRTRKTSKHDANISEPVWDSTEEINSNGHTIQKKKQESITIWPTRCNFCASQTRRTNSSWKKQ